MYDNKYINLFVLGFLSSISQIILLKEFLVSFYGNELSIGIILSFWLFWVALGSYSGNKINALLSNHERAFKVLIFIFSFINIITVLAIKLSRFFLNTPIGEYETILQLSIFSFLVLSINCFLIGYLFSLGATIVKKGGIFLWESTNKSYAFESLGSVFGGILFTFVLQKLFTHLEILLLLLTFSIFLLIRKSFYKIIPIFILMLTLYYSNTLDESINKIRWKYINDEMEYIVSKDTKYQNFAILKLNDVYSIYSDGKPYLNIPDKYSSEFTIHSIFTQSKNPKNILLIGGGMVGLLNEILKYDVQKVDYVDSDIDFFYLIEPYLDSSLIRSLYDKKINIVEYDGRDFVNKTRNKYDVVILFISDPTTLNQNRFFTVEFFNGVKSILTDDGVFSISFTSSEDYFSEELKQYNASLYHTFKTVFPYNIIIPGTKSFLIGAKVDNLLTYDYNKLTERYISRNINTEYFSGYFFNQMFIKSHVDFVLNTLENCTNVKINKDNEPITYYFNISLWNKMTKTNFLSVDTISSISSSDIYYFILLSSIFFIVLSLNNKEKAKKYLLYVIIFWTGFLGIIISLIIIMNFQTIFGSIYESYGVLISMAMLGLFIGSFFFEKIRRKILLKNMLFYIIFFELVFLLLLPILINLTTTIRFVLYSNFLMFFYNLFVGLTYSGVNYEYLQIYDDVGKIYSFDTFGSIFGSILFSIILLPMFGLKNLYLLLIYILIINIIFVVYYYTKK